jgi:hypothetical protein
MVEQCARFDNYFDNYEDQHTQCLELRVFQPFANGPNELPEGESKMNQDIPYHRGAFPHFRLSSCQRNLMSEWEVGAAQIVDRRASPVERGKRPAWNGGSRGVTLSPRDAGKQRRSLIVTARQNLRVIFFVT